MASFLASAISFFKAVFPTVSEMLLVLIGKNIGEKDEQLKTAQKGNQDAIEANEIHRRVFNADDDTLDQLRNKWSKK